MISAEGDIVYKGNWTNDQPHLHGTYYFRNGDTYDGNFNDGDYEGQGKFTTREGTLYDGQWLQGKRSGKANYYDARTGVLTVGLWEDDVFVELLSYKSLGAAKPGFDARPIELGFDFRKSRGVVLAKHEHGEHCDHGHGEACDHGHGEGGIEEKGGQKHEAIHEHGEHCDHGHVHEDCDHQQGEHQTNASK